MKHHNNIRDSLNFSKILMIPTNPNYLKFSRNSQETKHPLHQRAVISQRYRSTSTVISIIKWILQKNWISIWCEKKRKQNHFFGSLINNSTPIPILPALPLFQINMKMNPFSVKFPHLSRKVSHKNKQTTNPLMLILNIEILHNH